MRKAERLDWFYDEVCSLHKKYLCDWRFTQFMFNFLSWHVGTYGNDGFYLEEDECLERIKLFIKDSVGDRYHETN